MDEYGRADQFSVYTISALRVKPDYRYQILMMTGLTVLLGVLVLATACSNLGQPAASDGARSEAPKSPCDSPWGLTGARSSRCC